MNFFLVLIPWSHDYLYFCFSSGRSQHCPCVALCSYSWYFLVRVEKITGKSNFFLWIFVTVCIICVYYRIWNFSFPLVNQISDVHLHSSYFSTGRVGLFGFFGVVVCWFCFFFLLPLDGILKMRQFIIKV